MRKSSRECGFVLIRDGFAAKVPAWGLCQKLRERKTTCSADKPFFLLGSNAKWKRSRPVWRNSNCKKSFQLKFGVGQFQVFSIKKNYFSQAWSFLCEARFLFPIWPVRVFECPKTAIRGARPWISKARSYIFERLGAILPPANRKSNSVYTKKYAECVRE